MAKDADPRIVQMESWAQSLHLGIFDTMALAQTVVSRAQNSLKDVSPHDEDFLQLQRNYQVAVSIYCKQRSDIDQLIEATETQKHDSSSLNLHIAQLCAAGYCAISCMRMLDAIPQDMLEDEEVTGSLRHKAKGHLTMWQHLLGTNMHADSGNKML